MSNIAYTITDNAIVFMLDGRTYTIKRGDSRFEEVRQAIRMGKVDTIPTLLDLKGKLVSESNGGIYLLNGILRCDNYIIPPLLATRITQMFKEGFSTEPLIKFLSNLMENPSKIAQNELYGFIEACQLPITADGHFLAYKMVRNNFKDIYSGSMDNSVGQVLTMPRDSVDDNRNHTCSRGLHFCSEGYLGHYGTCNVDQVVIVKINPRDVVSIPSDYNNAKGRACRYEVVDTLPWDEVITPLFTHEYSEVESADGDNTSVKHNPSAKLNDKIVAEIRSMLSTGFYTIAHIAKLYGVSERTIRRIRDWESWKHVKVNAPK